MSEPFGKQEKYPLKVQEVSDLIRSLTIKQFNIFKLWSTEKRMDFLRRLAKARRDKKAAPVLAEIRRLTK